MGTYVKLTRFRKIRCDQLTQGTLYNEEAKSIRAAGKKDQGDDGIGERQRWKIEKVGKAVASETSAGGKRASPSTRRGVVSGASARIPSRLGEPGSLFSRYKFLQLRLVVVMLLTRTRRELLKRRTIDARIYPAASLSRASRVIPFVTAANPSPPPLLLPSLHPIESSSCASFRRLRLLTPVCAPSFESFDSGVIPRKDSQCLWSAFRSRFQPRYCHCESSLYLL